MLSNAYFLAKFRFDTAENEPAKNLQKFRKMHFRKMHFSKNAFFENALRRGSAGRGVGPRGRPRAPRGRRGRPRLQRRGAGSARRVGRASPADRQNFGKMLLVFGCIGTDFCKKICVLQHLSLIHISSPRDGLLSRMPSSA